MPYQEIKSYFFVSVILFILSLAFVLWYELFEVTKDSSLATVSTILQGMAEAVIVGSAATYFIVGGAKMIAEAFKKEQRKKGRLEGLAEADEKWRRWYEQNREHIKGIQPPSKPEED